MYAFSGFEEVCKPYEFGIELVSRSANVDLTALLGTPACLSIADRSGGERLVHGLIREMEQLHTANRFTHYRCSLVPRLWFLGQIRDHRIFQNLSVVEIIQQILKEQGFTADGSSFKLSCSYEPAIASASATARAAPKSPARAICAFSQVRASARIRRSSTA